jgi:phage N-6-adenine-methyltransferase
MEAAGENKVNNVHFMSEKIDWETPQDLFDELDREFDFDLDVCATDENKKCDYWLTEREDGLSESWHEYLRPPITCWMNPPYGDPELPCKKNSQGEYTCTKKKCILRGHHIDEYVPGIKDWMKKAYEESQKGCTVVCLVPSRTDTGWWHEYVMKADEIRFIRGRLKFGGSKNSAPFPSVIVIFRDQYE